ncbi:hypothetical protein OAB94_02430 [Flavobacteriaceae bacterium]|nr:hypothetical protein [Flavobacteriaceae bacterium]
MANQCIPLEKIAGLLPWEIPILYACDIWVVPHVLVVFILSIFIKRPWTAFLASGIWEIFEILLLMAFGNFSLFLQAGTQFENLGQALVSDWLIHGGIGCSLSWIFCNTFRFPTLINEKDWYSNPYNFFYFIFAWVLLISGYSFTYAVSIDGFRLGVMISPLIQSIVLIIIIISQPLNVWNGYTKSEAVLFWSIPLLYAVALTISNMFNWLYSSAIQVWFISGIFLLLLIIIGIKKGSWKHKYYLKF